MADIETLRKAFAIPDVVDFDAGKGGLVRAVVRAPGADAQIYLHGAHVTHFQPAGGAPLLFLSRQSRFELGKAIRGGVPIVFPWFGPKAGDPSAPMHGFARTMEWNLTSVRQAAAGDVSLTLELSASEVTRKLWPHDFHLSYTVRIAKAMELSLQISSPSEEIEFEEALHTYLAVGDVKNVSIDGLGGRLYLDKTDGMRRKEQPAGPFGISGETDRVYLETRDVVSVSDPALARRIAVEKQDSASTVVWNPWIEKARSLSDLADDEWTRMLCIESANVGKSAVKLPRGATHSMGAKLSIGSRYEIEGIAADRN